MKKANRIPQIERPDWPDYGVSAAQTTQMLEWFWVDEALARSRNYWITSTRADGRPHAMPVWGLWHEGQLFFGTSRNSVKGRNLLADPRTVVHLESGDEVVILEGKVTEITDLDQYREIFKIYAQKYKGFEPSEGIDPGQVLFAFTPQTALAWTEQTYPGSVTRWRFE